MDRDVQNITYACRCLNVRIASSPPPSATPQYQRDPNYTPIFVKDDGISVIHPQVTVRIPSKTLPILGTSRSSRFITLSCLFCQLHIYRVHQIISSDVVSGEAILLPTEEWVEREIMKSASGWIEVHKESIVDDDISKAESSSAFAPSFSLLLPSTLSPPFPPKVIEMGDFPEKPESSSEATPSEYLSGMRPVFQPPPFTPSHPVFVHLAAIASRESGQLRATAEERITDFINTERAGIEVKETDLRHQVEVLWKHFRRHLGTVEQERNSNASSALRSPTRLKEGENFAPNGLVGPSQLSSSVTIRSFVPHPISPVPHAPSLSAPRVSALSASLATTRFHHPKHKHRRSSSGGGSSGSYDSGSDTRKTFSSPQSASSTLVPPAPHADVGGNLLQFKRNIDDNFNTQTSYRYLVNLDEDMARFKRNREAAINQDTINEVDEHPKEAESSHASSGLKPTAGGNENPVTAQIVELEPSGGEGSKLEGETTPSRGRDKGKRKVTFDVDADVVTIPSERNVGAGEAIVAEDPRDMIFALEDLDGVGTEAQPGALPFIDQPLVRPPKVRRPRNPNGGGINEPFSSLRPASLPNPSHLRPMRSQPGVDSSSQGMIPNLPRASGSADNTNTPPRTPPIFLTPMTENDAALLKLVAADTPSHRGAWTPESKAWQMFTRRQDSKENVVNSNITENSEGRTAHSSTTTATRPVASKMKLVFSAELDNDFDENYVKTVPGSLPIQIHRKMQPRESLTLASYRPPKTVPEEPSSPTPFPLPSNKPLSSVAIRKAVYLERDRNRLMDPGALDFAMEEDDEDEESEGSEPAQRNGEASDVGEKGRKHALKILQARSELPAEGMWRSFA